MGRADNRPEPKILTAARCRGDMAAANIEREHAIFLKVSHHVRGKTSADESVPIRIEIVFIYITTTGEKVRAS